MPPFAIVELGEALARIPAPRTQLMAGLPITTTDDDLLASMLISMWALASGRFLRRGIQPEDLTEEELIDFWADDMTMPSGRHAAPSEQQPSETLQSEAGPTLTSGQ